MKNILNFLILTVLPLLASCSQELPLAEYLNLDKTSYTFSQEGGTLTVKVDANVEWNVTADAEWIKYEINGNDITFTAEKNIAGERSATISFTSDKLKPVILTLNQLCSEFSGSITYFGSDEMMMYSPKGHYAIKFVSVIVGGLPSLELYLINNNTDEISRLRDIESVIRNTANVAGISDKGHILYTSMDSQNSFSIYAQGNIENVTVPSYIETFSLNGISSDGNTVIGTGRKSEAPRPYVPFRWQNGTFEELQIPENNVLGDPLTAGVTVGGMSDDGSVIWGYDNETSANYSSVNGLVYWKDGEMHYLGEESADIKTFIQYEKEVKIACLIRKQGFLTSAAGPKVSPDGRYILAEYYDVDVNEGQLGDEHYYPVKIDVETGEYTIYKEYSDMLAYTVTDEGDIFGASPFISAGYIAEDGVVATASGMVSISDYFMEKYSLVMSDKMLMHQFIPEQDQYLGMKLTAKTMYGGQYQNFTVFTK